MEDRDLTPVGPPSIASPEKRPQLKGHTAHRPDRPTLLFIFAHPDDESFSGAGTAMTCAAAGARTILVTATLGERGKAGDPPVCAPGELAACRERELRDAAAIIGFDELHLLGYRDRELADAPPDEMRRALVAHIRRVRPALVLTFDPNGFNVHPDHVAISRFASDAIAAAADPRWHHDGGPAHVVRRLLWTPPIAPWDAASSLRLDEQPGADFVVDVSAWRGRRIAALRAHRSQHLSIDRHFFSKPTLDRILAAEIWRQAWGPALRARPAPDILVDL
jgi:LmbE family N-acetylglucosaminyl deacetylase